MTPGAAHRRWLTAVSESPARAARRAGEATIQPGRDVEQDRAGFLFDEPSTESLPGAVCRAFGTHGHKRQLNLMQSDAMANSFAWQDSVAAYHGLYRQVAQVA